MLAKGWGRARLQPDVPVEPDRTLFRVGSVFKTFTLDAFDEDDFREMQLDLRAPYCDHARDIVLEVVARDDPDPLLRPVRAHVPDWDGTAAVDQAGFRLLTVYDEALARGVLGLLLAPAHAADPDFGPPPWANTRESFLRILEERPAHLVPPGHESWPAFLRSTLERAGRLSAARLTASH